MQRTCAFAPLLFAAVLTQPLVSQTPGAAGVAGPTTVLAPGLNPVPDYRKLDVPTPAPQVPEGFTALFNGKDLTGWHISKTARHGTTPDFHVLHGVIVGTQNPLGRGGLLITDKKYKNYEFYMEAKPDWGNDSGIFFRTTEDGAAYQVTLDFLTGGSMGRFISEGGITVALVGAPPRPTPPAPGQAAAPAAAQNRPPDPGMSLWKHEEWNTVRVRVEGEAPHVTVWINGQQVSDGTATKNTAVGGMVEGPIALQIHGGNARWLPGGFWRWRNIAIKELP